MFLRDFSRKNWHFSYFRVPAHNRRKKGVIHSQHQAFAEADFHSCQQEKRVNRNGRTADELERTMVSVSYPDSVHAADAVERKRNTVGSDERSWKQRGSLQVAITYLRDSQTRCLGTNCN